MYHDHAAMPHAHLERISFLNPDFQMLSLQSRGFQFDVTLVIGMTIKIISW